MFALKETIRPSADLRNRYNEILRECKEGNSGLTAMGKSRRLEEIPTRRIVCHDTPTNCRRMGDEQ